MSVYGDSTGSGVLVKVEPPRCPADKSLSHVPCDIVLVIDVSLSMSAPAKAMRADEMGRTIKEDTGLSVLDITKHAARTILESLDGRDRLGIVTFSTDIEVCRPYASRCTPRLTAGDTKVLQELAPMNPANKQAAVDSIKKMTPQHWTNLWGGISEGLKLFQGYENSGRMPALLVLTDGMPTQQVIPMLLGFNSWI